MNAAEKLDSLDKQILKCKDCFLCKNRHHVPKWTLKSKYVMYTEYPYIDKPDFMKQFWDMAERYGLHEELFLQISTVQCSTDFNKRTKRYTRPAQLHRKECSNWFKKYIKALKPQKMISFGNIPMEELTGEFHGISEKHGTIIKPKFGGHLVPTVLSLPPSTLRNDQDKKVFRSVLQTFKELGNG